MIRCIDVATAADRAACMLDVPADDPFHRVMFFGSCPSAKNGRGDPNRCWTDGAIRGYRPVGTDPIFDQTISIEVFESRAARLVGDHGAARSYLLCQTMVDAEPNVGRHVGQEGPILVDSLIKNIDLNAADGVLAVEERDALLG